MYSVEYNDDDVSAGLASLSVVLTDMSPVMNQIGEILEDSTDERWQQGIAPDGTPWTPKSQTTLDAYKRRGLRASPLPLIGPNESGVPLRQSIFRQYGPDYVELGTNAIQAAVMQFGAAKGAFGTYQGKGFGGSTPTISIPWGDIPARPFLGVSEADRTNILDELAEQLADATRR